MGLETGEWCRCRSLPITPPASLRSHGSRPRPTRHSCNSTLHLNLHFFYFHHCTIIKGLVSPCKNDNSVVIYAPSNRSKPIRPLLISFKTQMKIFWMDSSPKMKTLSLLTHHLVFFAHKKYSRSLIKLWLNHWCHMDYFNDVLTTFLGLESEFHRGLSRIRISSFVLQRWTKVLRAWNVMRVSN